MKKMLKRIFCAVMMISLIITVAPTTYAAEDLLLLDVNFDNLNIGEKNALSSDEFIHNYYDYSNGDVTHNNVDITKIPNTSNSGTNVTTSINVAGYGKNGKAFFYNMDNVSAVTKKRHEFQWVPVVYSTDKHGRTNQKVTYEISIRTPENTGDGYQQFDFQIPVKGSKSRTMLSLQAKTNGARTIYAYDKTNGGTWNTICNWEAGRWYNIAVVFTPGTNLVDYYMNGKLVCNAIYSEVYDFVGGRLSMEHQVHTLSGNATYTDTFGIDDIRIYLGTPELEKYSTAVSSSVYSIDGNTIYLGSNGTDRDTFINNITVASGGSAEVYTDGTYSTVASNVTEGCKAVVTSANGKVLGYYTVGGKNVILDCDMEESFGIAENALPSFEGKLLASDNVSIGSLGFAGDFTTYAKGNVKEAGAAKDGYAYFVDVDNTTDKTVSPAIDFKFVPNITSGKVTFEVSLLAPAEYDKMRSALYVPYNGSYKALLSLNPDGKLGINNAYICQWVPGRWYNMAVEFTVGSANADFYLNGDLVLDDAEVFTNLNPDGVIGVVGGRMRFEAQTYAGASGVTAFDDVKVYCGEYDAANNVEFESINDDYTVSDAGFVFAPDTSVRVNSLKNYISGNYAVYEDDTFESTASYTGEDNVFVATSENGNIVKYYKLIPDGTFAITVNDGATTEISGRENVTIGAMARYENANVFAAAYDSEGNLLGVRLVAADAKSDASIPFNTTDGSYVKIMLWDNTTLKPVGDMVIIQK